MDLTEADPPGFAWPVRVYYEDTDAGGVVFYANYLKFMERARTEMLRALGCEQDRLRVSDGVILVVRQVGIDYLAPARFNDLLAVTSGLEAAGGASLRFAQQIRRDSDGALICRASVKVACVDAETLRPTPLPAVLSSKIGLAETMK